MTVGITTERHSKSSSCTVDRDLLRKAVLALQKHHNITVEKEEKLCLLGSDLPIHIQFTLNKVPGKTSSRPILIDIPHPLYKLVKDNDDGDDIEDNTDEDKLDDVEVCLIVKDESKPWIQELIAKFPSHLSYIKKVLTLTSLRKKHSRYSDRRQLVKRFDLFMADDRILPMLGKALGKSFFQEKKQPISIRLTRKEALPFAVKRCLKGTFMWVSAGTCVSIKAGNTAMSARKLSENMEHIVENAVKSIPRKWSNIAAISIKTSNSVALPVYNKTREELEEIASLAQIEEKGVKDENKPEHSTEDEKEVEKKKEKEKQELVKRSTLLKALKEIEATKKKDEEENTNTNKKKRSNSANRRTKVEIMKQSEEKTKNSKHNSLDPILQGKDMDEKVDSKLISSGKKRKLKNSTKKNTSDSILEDVSTAFNLAENKGGNSKIVDEGKAEQVQFSPCLKFEGSRDGYVYKKGSKGIGYYIDVKPIPNFAGTSKKRNRKSNANGRRKSGSRRKHR